MAPELGGSQISALLESVPGIASVLRSPVADALVKMIRAGAGLGDFALSDAQELVQYAVRRGLISADEGDELLGEVKGAGRKKRGRKSRAPARGAGGKARPANKKSAKQQTRALSAKRRQRSGKRAKQTKKSKQSSRVTGARRTRKRATKRR